MKTTTQFSRRGVSHTPQSHTHQSHTHQSHTHQLNMPQLNMPHHRHNIRLKGYDYSADGIYFITICTKNRQHLFGHVADGEMVLNETGQIVKSEWLNTVNVRQDEVILHEFVVMPNHFHAIIEISRRRGVSNTPLSHTPLSHTPLSHTPLSNTSLSHASISHTPNNGVCNTMEGVCDTMEGVCDTMEGVCDTTEGVCNTMEGVCNTMEGVCNTMEGVCNTTEGVCNTMEGVCDTMEGVCDTVGGVCDTPLRSPSKSLGAIVRGFKSAVSKKIGLSVWQRNYHEHIIRDSRGFEKISKYIRNNPACWDMDRFHN